MDRESKFKWNRLHTIILLIVCLIVGSGAYTTYQEIVNFKIVDTYTSDVISTEDFVEKLEQASIYLVDYNVEKDFGVFTDSAGKSYLYPKLNSHIKQGLIIHQGLEKSITQRIDAFKNKPLTSSILFILVLGFMIFMGYAIYSQYRPSMAYEGKNRHKLTSNATLISVSEEDEKIELRGLDAEMESINRVVDIINNAPKYAETGAVVPKGVLFYGPPGTGKTSLGKYLAQQCDRPFFYISASSLVEMYVGVGAKRIREVIEDAKRHAPSIVYIDEIDAVGKKRSGADDANKNDEREQTLNELLVSMDGIGSCEDILFIASTNRLDVLDPALVRPGRFTRKIHIGLPDLKGRLDIIGIYAKDKNFDPNLDFNKIARLTFGFSGADIKDMINEAAMLSVHKGYITLEMVDEAIHLLRTGSVERKNYMRNPEKTQITAYHEAGHAITSLLLAKDSVHKVTIVPSGDKGGYVASEPLSEDMQSKKELISRIKVLLAGRAAEYILTGDYDEVTIGASADLEQVSNILTHMVIKFAMFKEFGFLNLEHFKNNSQIEDKIREFSISYFEDVVSFLTERRELLDVFSTELMEKETLYEEDVRDIVSKFEQLPEKFDKFSYYSAS